jgi:hypothetical protein
MSIQLLGVCAAWNGTVLAKVSEGFTEYIVRVLNLEEAHFSEASANIAQFHLVQRLTA